MWILYVITALVVPSIQGALHPTSPCPSVFSYEGTEPERDRWYGIVLLTTEESLVGVRLDIKLDRPSQILVSWLGDVSTEDNERYTVLSLSQKLHPGPPLSSRFMVKFDANHGIPQVRTIRLNGRQICPPDPNFPIHHGSKGYSETGYMTERSTKRPDPVFPPPEVDLSPNRPVVKTTTEDYYNDFITTKRTTTRRYNYENDYLPQKQTNKNNYNSYEQDNAVTQTTTSNYYQGVHYTERPTSSFNVDSRPHQSSYSDDNPSHTDAHRTAERHANSGQNSNGDNSNNYVQPKPTTKRPAIQNSNNNNYGNNGRSNNNNNRQTTTHRPAVANSNSNNQKNNNNNNNSSSQQSKPVRKPEFSVIHVGVNSGTRVVATRNNENQFQKTTPNSYETSTQRTINRGSSDVVYPNPSSRPSSKNSSSKKLPAATTSRYHQRTADDLETASSNVECGRVQVSPAPLITNGQNTARGQWPWHIALYRIEGINLSYICGGSLISDSHVITAAHCVTKAPLDRPLPADVLVVYLGKYHLCQFSDDGGVQNKQVRDIHVFPQYNSSSFTGDIAVLELSSPVQFTTYVRPVCLWDAYETELSAVEGKEGTVVGWGYDENDQVTEELKMARMPVVSQETCIRSYPQFFSHFTSNKTFCAGFRQGTSVCNGDSGGGMVFPKGDIWYLRGLVSITVARQGVHVCDTRHFVVFADVSKYLHWIREIIT